MYEILKWVLLGLFGITALLLGIAALPFWSKETPAEAADTIERFLRGEVSDAEWDDFTCIRPKDAVVHAAKQRVCEIEEGHSCSVSPTYLDESGQVALREVAASLRAHSG